MEHVNVLSDKVDKQWLISILKSSELYESSIKEEFQADRNPYIIFDIGCYDGKDSVEFIELLKPNKCISYAFDIDDRSIEVFNKCRTAKPSDYVNIIFNRIAISDKKGIINFYPSHSDSSRWRHYEFEQSWSCSSSIKPPSDEFLKIFEGITFSKPQTVDSISLDLWYSTNLGSNVLISILWVDVNGGEQEFLLGAQNVLKRTKILVIEFSNKNLYNGQITLEKIIEMLPPSFQLERIYNFKGNYGDAIFINHTLPLAT